MPVSAPFLPVIGEQVSVAIQKVFLYGLVFVSVKNYRALILLVKILPPW